MFEGRGVDCWRGGRAVFGALGFALSEGDGLALKGPNGSGKSSLLRIMAGLLQPAGGMVFWRSRPIARDPGKHADNLCYVGHSNGVKPLLTTEENLRFWAALHHRGPALEHAVRKGLGVFGLSPLAGLSARLLSAGQRRRLCLARLLTTGAPLWLLDEPAAALDEKSAQLLETIIAAHRARGGIVVLASHGERFPADWKELVMDDFPALPTRNPAALWL
ncbi:cytochrome c biogenesis ATP-binding export protein CcmA [Alphaproteobacteria bacterium]|nr:cytochrome c biogenesis ATP-binding export protein CcmA [Alphaproteobacteria bacterium]